MDTAVRFGDWELIPMEERKEAFKAWQAEKASARIAAAKAYDRDTDMVVDIFKKAKEGKARAARTPVTTITFYERPEREAVDIRTDPYGARIDAEREELEEKRKRRRLACTFWASTVLTLVLIAVNLMWP